MKHLKPHRIFILLAILIFISPALMSQQPVKNFTDSDSNVVYFVKSGDLVSIHVDSTAIMNKKMFHIYNNYFERFRAANSSYKGVLNYYEAMVSHKDSVLTEKELSYQQLKVQFDDLVHKATTFTDTSSKRVTFIQGELNTSKANLQDAKASLDTATQLLAKEKRRANWRSIKFGFCGLVIGGVLAAIIIH